MIAATALLGLWAGLAYQVSRPQDPSNYLRTVLQVATSGHDAAATGVLAGRQELRQRVTAAFAATAYDDAMKAAAGAQKSLADSVAPDATSAALRDRLAPLVQTTARELSAAAGANDDATLANAVVALEGTAQQLNKLIEEHQ
jgi:phage gp29-like protein